MLVCGFAMQGRRRAQGRVLEPCRVTAQLKQGSAGSEVEVNLSKLRLNVSVDVMELVLSLQSSVLEPLVQPAADRWAHVNMLFSVMVLFQTTMCNLRTTSSSPDIVTSSSQQPAGTMRVLHQGVGQCAADAGGGTAAGCQAGGRCPRRHLLAPTAAHWLCHPGRLCHPGLRPADLPGEAHILGNHLSCRLPAEHDHHRKCFCRRWLWQSTAGWWTTLWVSSPHGAATVWSSGGRKHLRAMLRWVVSSPLMVRGHRCPQWSAFTARCVARHEVHACNTTRFTAYVQWPQCHTAAMHNCCLPLQALVAAPLGACLPLQMPSAGDSSAAAGKAAAANLWCVDNAAATFTVAAPDAGKPTGAPANCHAAGCLAPGMSPPPHWCSMECHCHHMSASWLLTAFQG